MLYNVIGLFSFCQNSILEARGASANVAFASSKLLYYIPAGVDLTATGTGLANESPLAAAVGFEA